MFTGLIERTGELLRIDSRGSGAIVSIAARGWTDPLILGESVAVEGVCLTVREVTTQGFTCDVLKETLSRTTLGSKQNGAVLNLERALRADSRLGGHFVSGHVDGVGRVARVGRAGPDWSITVEAPRELMDGIVLKGSIAVNGVSLTIARLSHETFDVHLIPHTWKETSLSKLKAGDSVNLETDMLGKYVKAFLDKTSSRSITMERLADAGFI